MTNWIYNLLALLIFPTLLGIIAFYFLQSYLQDWILILSYGAASIVATLLAYFFYKGKWATLFYFLIFFTTLAFNIPLQNWLFHSADDIANYASIEDLYNPEKSALYFKFDSPLTVDLSGRGSVTITRTTRTGRCGTHTRTTRHQYTVIPVFNDTLPKSQYTKREVKAWITSTKKPNGKEVLCYEKCSFDLDSYRQAAAKSRCKLHHADTPFIRPVYNSFITKTEWKYISMKTFCIVCGILIFTGIWMNKRKRK